MKRKLLKKDIFSREQIQIRKSFGRRAGTFRNIGYMSKGKFTIAPENNNKNNKKKKKKYYF